MRREFVIRLRDGGALKLGHRTLIVGVLNVTPDSFSDGGQYLEPARAVDRAIQLEEEGADIIEIGGESTRPGSARISAEEELARILPVLERLSGSLRVPISVDTYKSQVARAALDLGASIINDVSALRFDPSLARVAQSQGAALVLMHMRGEPATMQQLEPSPDILSEIELDLGRAVRLAEDAGVRRDRIILDPGIGFGKTFEQNLEILNNLDRLARMGLPLMVGTSRKSFIGHLTGKPPSERLWGTAASVAAAILKGAHLVRVHDVREMADVVRVADAIACAA
jgi:dihydropteroate synthase